MTFLKLFIIFFIGNFVANVMTAVSPIKYQIRPIDRDFKQFVVCATEFWCRYIISMKLIYEYMKINFHI